MSDFVLVRHDNGVIAPFPAKRAARLGLKVVEGETRTPSGALVKPIRDNGRPVKAPTTVAKKAAAKKASGAKSPEKKAVMPDEGAADATLTETKE